MARLEAGQGDAQRELEELEERERLRRVELYTKQALRRMQNAGITSAWTTWQEFYFDRLRERQLLQARDSAWAGSTRVHEGCVR